jgi:hypothetical protein
MDWSIDSPNVLIGVAAAAVLLIALLLIAGLRWLPRRARFDSVNPRKAVRQTLKAYKQSHPSFYEIIRACEKNRIIDQMMENEEVAHAFSVLYRTRHNQGKKKKAITNSVLNLGSPRRQIEASMVTIVRNLYLHADFRSCLTPQTDDELDRLLEALTK